VALKLGELVAYLKADDTALDRGIKAARSKLQQAGESIRQQGPVIGAALAAGIGAGLLQGMELDKARAKLAAQVGDPALAKQLGEVAGRVYGRGFGETAAESMDAARAVMASGLLPKGADAAVIEEITVKAHTLATALGGDVTQAARAAGQMVRTGIADNATEAFDILTRSMQVTGDQAGDLLETVTEYATQFREVGIDGQKAMGMLTQAAQAGARDLDTAADAIKEFAIRSKDGSETSADAFEAIGLNAEKMTAIFARGGPEADKAMKLVLDRVKAMKDPVAQDAAVVGLFGTKAEDLQDALYAMDPTTAVNALGQVEGASKRAGDALEQSASQKLTAFKRQVQSALVEKLAEALPYIEGTFGWLQRNSGWVGPLATGLGILAGIIGLVVLATKAWAAAQIALNIAMMLNPVGLIILAIIGLIALIVGLWLKFEGFRNFWIGAWEMLVAAAKWVVDWIVGGWTWAIGMLVDGAKLWWSIFSGTWTRIGELGVAVWNWIIDKGQSFLAWVGGLPSRLAAKARGMFDGWKAAFRSALNWIVQKWNDLSFRIPGISVPGLGQVWGGATISTPNIPMLAKGGHILGSGTAIVGERGPELVHLGRGATVQPLASGSAMAGLLRLLITGEFRIRGGDLVLVLREQVASDGGDVQAVIGSNR
jgi:hypothetical protein